MINILTIVIASALCQSPPEIAISPNIVWQHENQYPGWDWTIDDVYALWVSNEQYRIPIRVSEDRMIRAKAVRLPYFTNTGATASVFGLVETREDGWELLYRDFGSMGAGATDIPCYLLYNRHNGMLRMYYFYARAEESTHALLTIRFNTPSVIPEVTGEENANEAGSIPIETPHGHSALFSLFGEIDKAFLDDYDPSQKLTSLHGIQPGSWNVADVRLFGYDERTPQIRDAQLLLEIRSAIVSEIDLSGGIDAIHGGDPETKSLKELARDSYSYYGTVDGIKKKIVAAIDKKYSEPTVDSGESFWSSAARAITDFKLVKSTPYLAAAVPLIDAMFFGGGKRDGPQRVEFRGDIELEGKITSLVKVHTINLRLPGSHTDHPADRNSPLYDEPLGVFQIKRPRVEYMQLATTNKNQGQFLTNYRSDLLMIVDPIDIVLNAHSEYDVSTAEAAVLLYRDETISDDQWVPVHEFVGTVWKLNRRVVKDEQERVTFVTSGSGLDEVVESAKHEEWLDESFWKGSPRIRIRVTLRHKDAPLAMEPVVLFRDFQPRFEEVSTIPVVEPKLVLSDKYLGGNTHNVRWQVIIDPREERQDFSIKVATTSGQYVTQIERELYERDWDRQPGATVIDCGSMVFSRRPKEKSAFATIEFGNRLMLSQSRWFRLQIDQMEIAQVALFRPDDDPICELWCRLSEAGPGITVDVWALDRYGREERLIQRTEAAPGQDDLQILFTHPGTGRVRVKASSTLHGVDWMDRDIPPILEPIEPYALQASFQDVRPGIFVFHWDHKGGFKSELTTTIRLLKSDGRLLGNIWRGTDREGHHSIPANSRIEEYYLEIDVQSDAEQLPSVYYRVRIGNRGQILDFGRASKAPDDTTSWHGIKLNVSRLGDRGSFQWSVSAPRSSTPDVSFTINDGKGSVWKNEHSEQFSGNENPPLNDHGVFHLFAVARWPDFRSLGRSAWFAVGPDGQVEYEWGADDRRAQPAITAEVVREGQNLLLNIRPIVNQSVEIRVFVQVRMLVGQQMKTLTEGAPGVGGEGDPLFRGRRVRIPDPGKGEHVLMIEFHRHHEPTTVQTLRFTLDAQSRVTSQELW